jgi:hypothetical protein
MAKLQEAFDSRREVIGDSVDTPYLVFEAEDEAAVRQACWDGIPTACGLLPLKEVDIEERVNATTWRVVARYQKPNTEWRGPEIPKPKYAFDTGGGTQHITQSLRTLARYGARASALLGGAIGYDGKSVQGVDISVPVFNFSETHYFGDSQVTQSYKSALFALTGRFNNGAFRGSAGGEVLFMGASGSRQGVADTDLWEISFKFAALPNRSNITIGDITGIAKRGWDYLWVQYADTADTDTKQLIKRPMAVYIEQVYEEGNFSLLGIGA